MGVLVVVEEEEEEEEEDVFLGVAEEEEEEEAEGFLVALLWMVVALVETGAASYAMISFMETRGSL